MTLAPISQPAVSEESLATIDTIRSILKVKGSQAWSLPPGATVFEAIGMMAEKSVGARVVVEGGQVAGIVSERDYARKVILQGRSSKETLVREIMSTPVVTAEPGQTVVEGLRIMTARHIRHLPVLEEGALVGVVSIGDLVSTIISAQADTIQHLRNYVTGKYPG
jgi:CBS domain-containing protein